MVNIRDQLNVFIRRSAGPDGVNKAPIEKMEL